MIIIPANTLSTGGYEVANSCRFNDGDGANMNKAYGGSTDTKFTFSAWIKRGDLGNTEALFSHWNGSSDGNRFIIYFEGDSLVAYHNSSDGNSSDMYVKTSALYRDPSAWYHYVVAIDTTQGTAANRVKIYTNGVQQTSLSQTTYPDQNYAVYAFDTSGTTYLGRNASGDSAPTKFFDGYMAEVCLIDGTAYAASDFGEFDEDSPTIWKPKDVSGLTFGTNGTYLDFEDSGNLGDDESGNTNDLTETNIVAADQATDTCTNNFCTANPLDQYGSYTLSEGNCKISSGHTSWYTIGSTMAVQNGKWYWETEFDSGTMIEIFVGVHDTSVNRTDTNSWLTGSSLFYNDAGGEIRTDGTNSTEDYGTLTAGDILGIALNMDDKQITLYKNGSAIASNVALSSSISEAMPTFLTDANDVIFKVNFGGCSAFDVSSGNADDNGYGNFEYDVPTGYYALCTKNLAEFG